MWVTNWVCKYFFYFLLKLLTLEDSFRRESMLASHSRHVWSCGESRQNPNGTESVRVHTFVITFRHLCRLWWKYDKVYLVKIIYDTLLTTVNRPLCETKDLNMTRCWRNCFLYYCFIRLSSTSFIHRLFSYVKNSFISDYRSYRYKEIEII